MSNLQTPSGFILSDAALYAFKCQDVFPTILEFAVSIPDHLKPLFLIPVTGISVASTSINASVAKTVALKYAVPTGGTPEGDLFSYQTFKSEDNEPTVPSSSPGSIFDIDGADNLTHHQEYNFDENIQAPTDTSYMSDIDISQYFSYPYRSKEKPRHSSDRNTSISQSTPVILKLRIALSPDDLKSRVPDKIENNSKKCKVSLTSYDKGSQVFSFSVDSGNGPKDVKASLSDVDEVALSCNCKFWKYNGPEFHATTNSFMLGQPYGTASPPNVRDPDRKYWLCKHAAAVLKRLDFFVQEIIEENWELDDVEIMEEIDDQWDRLEQVVEVSEDVLDEDDIDIEMEWDEESKGLDPEPSRPEEIEEEISYDVDLSEFDGPISEDHPIDEAVSEDHPIDEAVSEDHPDDEIDYEALDEDSEPEYEALDEDSEPEYVDYEALDEDSESESEIDYEALDEDSEPEVDYEALEEETEEEIEKD